jgi:hypothetical protein
VRFAVKELAADLTRAFNQRLAAYRDRALLLICEAEPRK